MSTAQSSIQRYSLAKKIYICKPTGCCVLHSMQCIPANTVLVDIASEGGLVFIQKILLSLITEKSIKTLKMIMQRLKEKLTTTFHNCFGPPFLFVEGLLSMGPTPSSFYLLVEMRLPLHLFPAYML